LQAIASVGDFRNGQCSKHTPLHEKSATLSLEGDRLVFVNGEFDAEASTRNGKATAVVRLVRRTKDQQADYLR